jgi:hypothetical protein
MTLEVLVREALTVLNPPVPHGEEPFPPMMATLLSRKGCRTVAQAAALFTVSRKTIRNLLSEHRDRFDPPRYGRVGRHPRRLRLLTMRDLARLDRLLSMHLSGGSSAAPYRGDDVLPALSCGDLWRRRPPTILERS